VSLAGREQEGALIVGGDIDLLIEGDDYGTLEDDAGGVDVRQHGEDLGA
jgi:hypothetical protein